MASFGIHCVIAFPSLIIIATMFGDVNEKVGTIAAEVGKTPQAWNANIFSMIQSLSENVIVPIAGLVITYVLCYELKSMVIDKNNMHDFDTFMFFKWFFKAWVAVFLVTHTFDITMAVFDVAQHVVARSAGVIGGSTSIDVASALSSLQAGLDSLEIPELLLLTMETTLVSFGMKIMSVIITVVIYGRMIEIYLYCSVSPIPFATLTNREWGQIGNNFLRGLIALGFQGFLIMVCVGIYAVLVKSMVVAIIKTEFQKMKRYHILLVGMIGMVIAPVLSLLTQTVATDEGRLSAFNFTSLINSSVWNNATIFMPIIFTLIGG
ncbi:MAG: ABC transporter permease [Oscillospiraceae bacterium]|nr:ABC transporter permease [Oscillospiraceae bacterium]